MNVQPISYVPRTNYYDRPNVQKRINNIQIGDTVSFTSYDSALKKMAYAKLERESHVEEYFNKLMQSVWNNPEIDKTETFGIITNMYTKKGLRGMLMEFWDASPKQKIEEILNSFGYKVSSTIAEIHGKKGNSPIVRLYNLGKHGFLNRKNAPRDIRLVFQGKTSQIEIYLDKKGDLAIEQILGKDERFTAFHSLTGHRKVLIESFENSKPEAIYYKKDGTKDFWKNLFLGGIAPEAIY